MTQPDESYRVTLAKRTDGSPPALEWTGTEGGQAATYHVDPHAGLLRNVMTGIFTLLPVDDQLWAATAPAKPAIPVRGER